MQVTMRKDELIARIRKNRDAHREIFAQGNLGCDAFLASMGLPTAMDEILRTTGIKQTRQEE